MEHDYPDVFADNGIPFTIVETGRSNEDIKYSWTAFLFLGSAGTLPVVTQTEHDTSFVVSLGGTGGVQAKYDIGFSYSSAVAFFTPFPLFFFRDPLDTRGYRGFCKSDASDTEKVKANRSAIGYGTAVRLKELERDGMIKAEIAPKPIRVTIPPAAVIPSSMPIPSATSSQVFEVDAITL